MARTSGLNKVVVGVAALFWVLPLLHLLASWAFLLSHRRREFVPPDASTTVDVFVTAYDEPVSMVRRCLAAARSMDERHETWLLDDGNRPELRALAQTLQVRYLARGTTQDRKAGNVNHALQRSHGELIAIFDVDHAPRRDFLTQTLGQFRNPRIGFVQAMVSFANAKQNWVSRASDQTTREYYELLAAGTDCWGAVSLMGTNAVLRRKALEKIGGYQPGLAEDLETSVRLHAAGWQSAYVNEPLAPGLTPADLPAFVKQQKKWARGVFDAAWQSLRSGSYGRLTFRQRICYGIRFTNYLMPVLFGLGLLLLMVSLVADPWQLESYAPQLLPVFLAAPLIRQAGFRLLGQRRGSGWFFAGASLVASCWTHYLAVLGSFLIGRQAIFQPTPKTADSVMAWRLLVGPLAFLVALGMAGTWRVLQWDSHPMPFTLAIAVVSACFPLRLLVALLGEDRSRSQAPQRATRQERGNAPHAVRV